MSRNGEDGRVRVALISVGLGRVQRGFERFFQDLFHLVQGEVAATIFKSRGTRSDVEVVPPLLGPVTLAARTLRVVGGRMEYHWDCLAFGLTALPLLVRGGYDVIHCIDPPMAKVVWKLARLCRLRSRILYTEGCAMPPEHYPESHHLHQVAPATFEDAAASGIPEEEMTLIPCGLHTDRFTRRIAGRRELRRKHGVPEDATVILSVSAVNRHHKRIDHLIEETSRLPDDVLLLIDGNMEDRGLVDLAARRLGPRCRFLHVPSEQVIELYRLADILVQTSLFESFGMAVVEAMCSGLCVLTHDSPHFRWLVPSAGCLVDMSAPGSLSARLHELMHDPAERRALAACNAEAAVRRFDWRSLKRPYVDLYRRVAGKDDR